MIDIATADADRFLQVGKGGKVDFTGRTRSDATMMSFQPANVSEPNRVVIVPPFWNEEVGTGYCVAATPDVALALEKCVPGKSSQIWRVQPAGDSGLFELRGAYGAVGANNVGSTLQVLPFAG
ncbi:hypothetical protein [Paractinoplanes ferrugineus]|uniref:hypothetical protein n=1 Tax=Paractinoplanes ferrugineus TaxID=113564 RepID=UPI001940C3DC|nr:hypothetical protein [Actinoplanes ferrugineus]